MNQIAENVSDQFYKEVETKVKAIVAEHLEVEVDNISENAHLVEELGADSLDLVELVMAFEDEFGYEITDDQAEKLVTIKDAVLYIVKSTIEGKTCVGSVDKKSSNVDPHVNTKISPVNN